MQQLLTVQELADRLRVPPSWVYSKTRKDGPDTMPFIRVGKYCRFIESEVMAWLQSKQRHFNGTVENENRDQQ